MTYLGRIRGLRSPADIIVLGCGPHPDLVRFLAGQGHNVSGVEPFVPFVETAREHVGTAADVLQGAAEDMPLPDRSADLVVLESVLEHVDSVSRSLEEIYRVLKPGGMLYLTTTNRHMLRLTGANGEYNIPFFNWMPGLLKECYVHDHLHYRPHLANYTSRPAVHWFTYADLCGRGREAGFHRFYSILDLVRRDDESVRNSRIRRTLLPVLQRSAPLKALALTEVGYMMVMCKRG